MRNVILFCMLMVNNLYALDYEKTVKAIRDNNLDDILWDVDELVKARGVFLKGHFLMDASIETQNHQLALIDLLAQYGSPQFIEDTLSAFNQEFPVKTINLRPTSKSILDHIVSAQNIPNWTYFCLRLHQLAGNSFEKTSRLVENAVNTDHLSDELRDKYIDIFLNPIGEEELQEKIEILVSHSRRYLLRRAQAKLKKMRPKIMVDEQNFLEVVTLLLERLGDAENRIQFLEGELTKTNKIRYQRHH